MDTLLHWAASQGLDQFALTLVQQGRVTPSYIIIAVLWSGTGFRIRIRIRIRIRMDPQFELLDPDPHLNFRSGSGSRRAKMTHKKTPEFSCY